jgi:OmpA-OmpF porin, OOP family
MSVLRFLIFFLFSVNALSQKLESLGNSVNSEFNELHPLISPDGKTLYFARTGHPSNNYGKDGSCDVWYSDLLSNTWTLSRKMPNVVNKDQFNELFSVSPDGNSALIRGVFVNGRYQNEEVGLSICKKKGVTWQQPEKLDIPKLSEMCKGQFLTAFMANNQKTILLSFSEKKNGKVDDLYFTSIEKNGKWTKPQPLGASINTDASESTPFLASDNNTLYFASDRKGGEGGYDIWVSKRTGKNWTSWTKPLNMGKIVNSKEDEFYYTIDASGQYAYLNSRNNSMGKADLFKLKLFEEKKAVEPAAITASENLNTSTKKDETEKPSLLAPNTVILISGVVKDQLSGKPIEAKIIYEELETGEELGIAYSNATTGEYKLALPYGKRYAVRAEAKDFIPISKNYDFSNIDVYKEIVGEDLTIAPIQTGIIVQLNNIFFQFGRADLEEVSFFELDRMVSLLNGNPNMILEVQGHTDNVGSSDANLRLSQQRADAVKDYILGKKIGIERVRSKGFGEAKPIANNNSTEGQAKNRRVEFEIIRK